MVYLADPIGFSGYSSLLLDNCTLHQNLVIDRISFVLELFYCDIFCHFSSSFVIVTNQKLKDIILDDSNAELFSLISTFDINNGTVISEQRYYCSTLTTFSVFLKVFAGTIRVEDSTVQNVSLQSEAFLSMILSNITLLRSTINDISTSSSSLFVSANENSFLNVSESTFTSVAFTS